MTSLGKQTFIYPYKDHKCIILFLLCFFFRAAVRGVIRYNNFIIGRSNDNTGVANLGQITVDEFRFWPKLLSQKQIQENGEFI